MREPIDLFYLTAELDDANDCACPSCSNNEYYILNNPIVQSFDDDSYELRGCATCGTIILVDIANVYDAQLSKPVKVENLERIRV